MKTDYIYERAETGRSSTEPASDPQSPHQTQAIRGAVKASPREENRRTHQKPRAGAGGKVEVEVEVEVEEQLTFAALRSGGVVGRVYRAGGEGSRALLTVGFGGRMRSTVG